jgi:hypothetical protein
MSDPARDALLWQRLNEMIRSGSVDLTELKRWERGDFRDHYTLDASRDIEASIRHRTDWEDW